MVSTSRTSFLTEEDNQQRNKEEVTVGGKILRKMMIENKLTVVNSLKCTKGLWTREQGDSKSIIDFVITKTEDETDILNMIIDENKWISPMRIIKKME